MKLTTPCEMGACLSLETPCAGGECLTLTTPCSGGECLTLTAPCDGGQCISLTGHPDSLVLSSNQAIGSVVVTPAEVRQFAAAVMSGYFDPLLGDGQDG